MITVKIKNIPFLLPNDILLENEKKEENLKAMIRGAFMGSGSVNNPEKEYHLEVDFINEHYLEQAVQILRRLGLRVKTLGLAMYIKEGEEISKFLALIGANKAVMHFEDIRIQKEMRGKVNRLVNCEAANLNKTINASVKQIAAIKKLQETKQFQKLDENVKELALLRLENPDMSLIELGKKLKEPVGKSGVNYRLKKIIEMAEIIWEKEN